jgi:tape measure domain-containing protein
VANAQSRVELIVDAVKALNPLRKVKNETKQLEQAVRGAQNNIRGFNRQIRDTGSAAKSASIGVNSLGRSIRGLLAGFTAIQAARFVIFKTAELETQTRSLQVLTGSLDNAKSIIAELQAFGAVTPFTSAELIETAKRLKAFGFETEKIVDVTKRLSDVAGATGADLGGIATAFGQIQAKGRLQGEELLQLQERGVDIAGVLREEYKLSADEFRKALESGRIGADAVNFALEKLTETGGKYAGGAIAQSDTLSGKFSTLVDGVENIARVVGTVLSPAIKAILDQAIGAINSVNQLINIGRRAQQFGLTQQQRTKILRQAEEEAKELALIRGGGKLDPALFNQIKLQREKDLIEQYGYKTGQIIPEATTPALAAASAPPALLAARTQGKGKGKKTGKTPFEQQAEAGQKLLQQLQDQTRLATALTGEEQKRLELSVRKDKIDRDFPLLSQEARDVLKEQLDVLYGTENVTASIKDLNEANAKKQAEALKQQQQEAQRLEQIYGQLGQTIATGVTDMLMAAVDGTKSLAEVASNMLKNLANQLLQVAVNTALFSLFPGSSLFKSLPRFADGGSISGGKPAIVGERGPELFMPGRSGSIIPNNAMGGANIVVNVDAKGTQAQGDQPNAAALGRAIGAAVQAELIKQKRPGGLLA